jgi:hypothetical protein
MLMIRTLRRVSSVLPLTRGLTDAATAVFIVFAVVVVASVDDAVHVPIGLAIR